MPNCFQLTPKGSTTPEALTMIDQKMCAHFNATCDEVRYHAGWYDVIGFRLAMGRTFEQIREYLTKAANEAKHPDDNGQWYSHLVEICDWLSDNYTADAWAEIGRR